MPFPLRLGFNVDHVATLRNARDGTHPDPVRAALAAAEAGADGITAHLREDRRHIREADLVRLKTEVPLPLNLEMAVTAEMISIAEQLRPHAVCLVPEKRQEVTTEGGLDVLATPDIREAVRRLSTAGIRVSLFIDPDRDQLVSAREVGAPVVELHTGRYCETKGEERQEEFVRLYSAAAIASELGIECHAGHGLTYDTVSPVAAIPSIMELNIGHFLVGEAILLGLGAAVSRMKDLMLEARQSVNETLPGHD